MIYVQDRVDTWHLAKATYPNKADCACGSVEAKLFGTEVPKGPRALCKKCFDGLCRQCGKPVEDLRFAWATPVCYACVPARP